jgi:hypothetical protein
MNPRRRPTSAAIDPPNTGPSAGPSRCAVCTVPIACPMRAGGAESAAIVSASAP